MRRSKRYIIGVLLIAVFLSALYIARRPILTGVATLVVYEEKPEIADAILILNGMFPRGILEAADLYHAKKAPRVLVTSERWVDGFSELHRRIPTIADQTDSKVQILQQLGVSKTDIIVLETIAESTRQEAKILKSFLDQQKDIRRILIVARRPQTRRAKNLFSNVLGDERQVYVVASKFDEIQPDNWWHDRWHMREMVSEMMTYIYYGLSTILPVEPTRD